VKTDPFPTNENWGDHEVQPIVVEPTLRRGVGNSSAANDQVDDGGDAADFHCKGKLYPDTTARDLSVLINDFLEFAKNARSVPRGTEERLEMERQLNEQYVKHIVEHRWAYLQCMPLIPEHASNVRELYYAVSDPDLKQKYTNFCHDFSRNVGDSRDNQHLIRVERAANAREILDVPIDATPKMIRSAFRKLSLHVHPGSSMIIRYSN
jgi:hypothetical protein